MTLNFAETSPGVHMAQLEDSSKGTFRTIVIIESLGKFTLYVDGEVALRDLPTFEAAASQADAILTKKGSRRMVQVATALVVLSMIGGTAVGAVNLLSGSSPLAIASAAQSTTATAPLTESAVASENRSTASTTSTERLPSPTKPVVINAPNSETAAVAPASEQPDPSPVQAPPATPNPYAQNASQAPEPAPATPPSTTAAASPTDTADAEQPDQGAERAITAEPVKPKRRVFSATRPVFGGVRPPAAEGSATIVTVAPSAAEQPATEPPVADVQPVEAEPAPNPYATTATAPQPAAVNDPAPAQAEVAEREPQPVEDEGAQVVAVPLPNKNPLAGESNVAARTNVGEAPARVAIAPQPDAGPAIQEPPAAETEKPAERQQPIYPITAAPRRAEKKRAFGSMRDVRPAKKARKHRKARRHARRHERRHYRRGRVMRCMYGGCRWVKTGGYYDRQYRRHRHLYGRLTKY